MPESHASSKPWFFVVPMLLAGLVLVSALVVASTRDLPFPGWTQIILCFGLAGAFGGILASIQHINLPSLLASSENEHWTRERMCNVVLALLIGAMGGVGGAGAALFVMLVDSKIKVPPDDLGRLSAITSGLLGGFVGFQLLKRVAEQALNPAAKAEAELAGKKAATKVAKQLADERGALNEAITEGRAICSTSTSFSSLRTLKKFTTSPSISL